MRLPDQYQCDWPECDRTDTAKVTIIYDGMPRSHMDLCPPHAEPLLTFIKLSPSEGVSRSSAAVEEFIRTEPPGCS